MGRTLRGTVDRTAHQLRQTLKGRDQEGHHDSEKSEGCRAGRDTGRSHQSRHGDSCQHAIQPLQQDLGEGGGTRSVERRNHHQAAKTGGCWPKLQEQQAGFRRNKSCADQITSLHIIVEQSLEWNSPLYINFIAYEKAFDSVDRETMWKLLRHYEDPEKIISLIYQK